MLAGGRVNIAPRAHLRKTSSWYSRRATQVLLGARQEPVHRPALAVLVDERHHVLVLRIVVHVVVLGDRLRVAARLRVRREVVDHLAAAEHAAAVAKRLQVLLAGPDHERLSSSP